MLVTAKRVGVIPFRGNICRVFSGRVDGLRGCQRRRNSPFPGFALQMARKEVTDRGFSLGHHRSPLTSADTKEGGLFGLWLEHHFGDQKLTFPGRDGSAGNTLMAKASDPSLITRNARRGRRGQMPANFPLA